MKKFNKSTLAAAVGTAVLALGVQAPANAEVSISGWINEGLTYADDGNNSDVVQMTDNGTTLGSRITFAGSTDYKGLTFGFETIIEPQTAGEALGFGTGGQGSVTAFDGESANIVRLLGSSVHVGGRFGKLTLGDQSMPTDNIAVLADPSTTLWSSISPVFRGNGILVQGPGGAVAPGISFGSFMSCLTTPGLSGGLGIGLDCNGIYRQGVRYDLPQFVDGLNIAVGYANDDVYDVAAKYNTELMGRVTTILHLGYAQNNGINVATHDSADNFQAQLGLMDQHTGLFGTFAFQLEDADRRPGVTAAAFEDDTDAYWLKVGVKRQFNSYGDTSFAFQYGSYNDQYGALGAAGVTGSEVTRLGLEANQYFGDSMLMYVSWENLDLDVDGTTAFARAVDSGEDLDTVTLGFTYFF